ncbi:MAG: hypothetical protein ACHQJ5_11390 [Vicinamibacteria bacterium]|jgi:zinc transporter ZupT
MTPEEKKRRNYVIAGAVGGFLLPLAGIVGALVFNQRGDPKASRTLAFASAAGIVAYAILFGAV